MMKEVVKINNSDEEDRETFKLIIQRICTDGWPENQACSAFGCRYNSLDIDQTIDIIIDVYKNFSENGSSPESNGLWKNTFDHGQNTAKARLNTADTLPEEFQTPRKNIQEEVEALVETYTGLFSTSQIYSDLQIKESSDKRIARDKLWNLVKKGIIEPNGKRSGHFRKINKELIRMEYARKTEGENIIIPLGIHELVNLYPGNIAVIAGSKDAGKTAFLMNLAVMNTDQYKVHYFNSECGPEEMTSRVDNFEDIRGEKFFKNINIYERDKDFHDVIVPGKGNLNIIDFLEKHNDFYTIGEDIKKIHDALKGAICFIGLQKQSGKDVGRGGEFTLEKARLYLVMDKGKVLIKVAKNWKVEGKNPRGMVKHFSLVKGCRFIEKDKWADPDDTGEDDLPPEMM
jgi:hypothetical protein